MKYRKCVALYAGCVVNVRMLMRGIEQEGERESEKAKEKRKLF